MMATGAVVYAVPVRAAGLKVTFDAQLGGDGGQGGSRHGSGGTV